MATLLERLIYTSFGAAVLTREKLKELVEDLIQNSQFTEEEGKRIVDAFLFDVQQRTTALQEDIRFKTGEWYTKLSEPSLFTLREELEQYIQKVKQDPSLLLKLHGKGKNK